MPPPAADSLAALNGIVSSAPRPIRVVLLTIGLAVLATGTSIGGNPPLLTPRGDGSPLALPGFPAEGLTPQHLDPAVPTPTEVLGRPLGDRFVTHEEIDRYFDRLAAASDRVVKIPYGRTYEDRPLFLAAIGSPRRIADLEAVRRRHIRAQDPSSPPLSEETIADAPVIVWLAYGVHGNESSSPDAAMLVAYVLAAARGEWAERLDDAVVLIDPCVNPDGRQRYVSGFRQRRGRIPNGDPHAVEHREPWPDGRGNHYLLDLNRDWAWATQVETRHRLALYRAWEPQVYVDFHEMGPQSTYFFPPAADPVHPRIDPAIVDWLGVFGRANGEAFDRQGWSYYTGEHFDLYYPGYGDSYPALRGAVGMTYEVAGHSGAGLAFERADGTTLRLADRILRHATSSLATLATAIENRLGLLSGFRASHDRAVAAPAKTYLWRSDASEAEAAADLLRLHGIESFRLGDEKSLVVSPVRGGAPRTEVFPAGTWAVSTAQRQGELARALLEREAGMNASFLERQRQRIEQNREAEFYDITAWSLDLAYGLELREHSGVVTTPTMAFRPLPPPEPGTVGYAVRADGLGGYRFAAGLQRAGFRFRWSLRGLATEHGVLPPGTLFLPRRDNADAVEDGRFSTLVRELALETRTELLPLSTGYAPGGLFAGSDSMVRVLAPRIGLLTGEGTRETSVGALWHLLDVDLGVDHVRLDLADLSEDALRERGVLILPDGRYDRLPEEQSQGLLDWVDAGGILVAIAGAVEWLHEIEALDLQPWAPDEDGDDKEGTHRPLSVPGAAFQLSHAPDHPLAIGLPSGGAGLVLGDRVWKPTGDPRRDALRIDPEAPVLAGFAWPEAWERLRGALFASVTQRGGGRIVAFSYEPTFRLFWRSTAPPLLNAVLFGPSLVHAGAL